MTQVPRVVIENWKKIFFYRCL